MLASCPMAKRQRRIIKEIIKIGEKVFEVQLDRNYGICDLQPRVKDVLTHFQGQQFRIESVKENLTTALADALTEAK